MIVLKGERSLYKKINFDIIEGHLGKFDEGSLRCGKDDDARTT